MEPATYIPIQKADTNTRNTREQQAEGDPLNGGTRGRTPGTLSEELN